MEEIPFQDWLKETEKDLRGKYLSITVDIDYMLIMIISECFKFNRQEIRRNSKICTGKPKDLHELTMFEKIDVCKMGLAEYFPLAYKEHEDNFGNIDSLRKVRNDFAHCRIDDFISPKDRSKLTINDLRKDFKVLQTEYNVSDLYKALEDYYSLAQDIIRLIAKVTGKPAPVFPQH